MTTHRNVPLYCVLADRETGEWIGNPVAIGKAVILTEWLDQGYDRENTYRTTWENDDRLTALVVGFVPGDTDPLIENLC